MLDVDVGQFAKGVGAGVVFVVEPGVVLVAGAGVVLVV